MRYLSLKSFGTESIGILYNIIERKTNTKYFIKFQNLPSEYGILKIDEYEINSTDEYIEIKTEMQKLIFTSNNYNTVNELKICYEIKIQETYSEVQSSIRLTIKECYHSCKGCTVDNSSSTESDHHCIECKEGYFPDPTKSSNCYEPEPYECYHDCLTCNGSLYNNCLNCSEERVLYKGECITYCPKGTFKTDDNGINVCKNCHPNCEACNELGNSSNMKCLNCSNDKIKNDENCYQINDYQIKTFIDPENQENILSCKETFGKYILENTSECIVEPENSYFFINNKTGVISFCDNSCETCSNSPTNTSANCDSCYSDTIYNLLQNGNCVSNCSEGYYQNGNKCLKCHKNCLTCDMGFDKNSAGKLINMKCTKCLGNPSEIGIQQQQSSLINQIMIKNEENCFPVIERSEEKIIFDISEIYPGIKNGSCLYFNKSIYSGQNECIEKPEKTFYVLNNTKNTGVIKNCSEECDTCLGEKTSESTNCIKCAEGYYKKEESTTNCILENLIPVNYYLNETDKIYYKCHPYCYNCTKGYDPILQNTNCISCNNNLIDEKTSSPYFFKLLENGNCIKECQDNYYLTNQGDCVLTCPKGFFQFSKNFTCLENCPENYEIDNEQNKCIIKSYENIPYSEFKTKILNNITEFLNFSYAINGSDFIAVIYTSDKIDPKDQLKYGISAVDLGNCTEEIKEHHNIPKDEDLIILNMESKRNESKKDEQNGNNAVDVGKINQIEIFDKSGRKLNLSICKEDIRIMKYLGDIEEIDLQSASDLANRGIDVFNASDEFFNNLCHKYNNTDEIDIIIDDRRTDIYQNVSFCQKGCSYTGIDYDLSTANCICDSNVVEKDLNNISNISKDNNKEEKENTFKYIKKSFIANLMDFNINVIYCYNLIIDFQILKSNIGFYSMAALLSLQIIFLFVYIFQKLKSLKNFMLTFDDKINNNKTNNNEINKDNKNKKKSNASFPPPKNQKLKSNKEKKYIENNKRIKNNFKNIKRQKVNSKIKGRKIKDKSNSSRKLQLTKDVTDIINDENTSKINSKNDLLKFNNIFNNNGLQTGKEKASKKNKLSFSNINYNNNLTPFSPFINMQSPIININNTKQVKLPDNDEYSSNINNNQANEIKLEQKHKNKIISKKKRKKIRKNKNKNFSKIKGKDINNMETIDEGKKTEIEQKGLNLLNTDEDIQDLDYEKAILYDKRSYLRMYWSFLIDTQIILGTFFTDNYLNLFIIKLSFLVCTFQISFFLNALFYTDEYISDAYHNDGALDFITGLPKSFYSFIATLITTNLLRMLSNSKSELKKLILEKRLNKNFISLINSKLRKLKIKLVIYFILVFSLGLIFLYYVSAFCAVYRYSQKYWFMGCLESFGMDSAIAVIVCFVLALFRYIAIKRRIKCFYSIANLISTFL